MARALVPVDSSGAGTALVKTAGLVRRSFLPLRPVTRPLCKAGGSTLKAHWSRGKEDGKWLVKAVADEPFEELPAEGDEITVTKKNGETQTVTLKKKLWEGEGKYDSDKGLPVALYALD